MLIAFYISGHGFGHASRDIEVINAVARLRPDDGIRWVARTTVPAWLFGRASVPVDLHAVESDTGMVQIDSLQLDERASAQRAAAFYSTFEQRVNAEARVLRTMTPDLVVGDIPPLAFAAAERAGVRSMALGNFTWDWIYDIYPAFHALAPDIFATIRAAYATATRTLRLPFHGGFESMAGAVEDIPLIARRSRRDPADTRRLLGVDSGRPLVLASFGAYGAQLPCDALRAAEQFTFLTIDRDPPFGLLYEDLVAAADVVISKPGYGIVSECIANDTALLYAPRGRFVEYDLLVAEMPHVLRCREISQADLSAGAWADAIASLLAQPAPRERPRVDGAEVAATKILNG